MNHKPPYQISTLSLLYPCSFPLASLCFLLQAQLWMEFVPQWEIRAEQNKLVGEWIEVAAYQKPLRSKAYPPESSPDTGKELPNYLQRSQ